MPGRSTIYQVARALGVSASTVSRAFNAPHKLLPSTVERVRAKAEEMGYVPNRYAQALSTGRTKMLGLVVPDLTNPFFPPLIRAAQRTAENSGFSVLVAETNSSQERERALLATLIPHCEGVVIASPRLPPAELQEVGARTSLMLINNDTPGLARVLMSTEQAIDEAVSSFAQAGARSFLYVGGPRRSWSEQERRGTLERCSERLGLEVIAVRVESGTYAEARTLAAEYAQGVDAVVAFDDIIACGVLDGLGDVGVPVPDRTRLLGCDDALPVRTRPRISTIQLPTGEATHIAVQKLVAGIGSKAKEIRMVLHGVLRIRET